MSNMSNNNMYEVAKVVNHRTMNGNLEFLIKFTDRSMEWVPSENCNECHREIMEYLNSCEEDDDSDPESNEEDECMPEPEEDDDLEVVSNADTEVLPMIVSKPTVAKVFVVCRVSSKKQAGPTHVSLDVQMQALKRVVDNLILPVPYTAKYVYYTQISASAYTDVPVEIAQIAEDARSGDYVFCYRVDRLSRNIFKFLSVLESMYDNGVKIFSHEEGIWYTRESKLAFVQMLLDAHKESENLSRKIRKSVVYRRERGDWVGSTPYGYMLKREDSGKVVKVVSPKEQEVIALVQAKAMVWTDSLIVKYMSKHHITKRGRPWTLTMVKDMVKSLKCQVDEVEEDVEDVDE